MDSAPTVTCTSALGSLQAGRCWKSPHPQGQAWVRARGLRKPGLVSTLPQGDDTASFGGAQRPPEPTLISVDLVGLPGVWGLCVSRGHGSGGFNFYHHKNARPVHCQE